MPRKKDKPYYIIDDSILSRDFINPEPKPKKAKPKKQKPKK